MTYCQRQHRFLVAEQHRPAREGFTLIEVLVVISIIGLLVAVALPALSHVRESSRRATCAEQLHQLGIAIQQHDNDFGHLPKDGENGWGVHPFLLPQIEQRPLYDQLKPQATKRNSLSSDLAKRLETRLAVLECPSFVEADALVNGQFGRTSYLGTSDLFSKRLTLTDILDGESTTIAFSETTRDQAWALPGLGDCSMGPNQGIYASYHSGGVNVVFCDGRVTLLGDSIDLKTFQALCTPQGRDVPGSY